MNIIRSFKNKVKEIFNYNNNINISYVNNSGLRYMEEGDSINSSYLNSYSEIDFEQGDSLNIESYMQTELEDNVFDILENEYLNIDDIQMKKLQVFNSEEIQYSKPNLVKMELENFVEEILFSCKLMRAMDYSG